MTTPPPHLSDVHAELAALDRLHAAQEARHDAAAAAHDTGAPPTPDTAAEESSRDR